MKNLLEPMAWITFWLSLVWIIGSDLPELSAGQLLVRLAIGAAVLGLDVIVLNRLGGETEDEA